VEIDSRGPRFGAAITVVVLALVLITGSGWLLAAQVVVFAVGALAGLRYAPYGLIYRWLIRPRLGPPAQGVGMVIAAAGVVCYALGETTGGLVFTALALIAAFLNAVFDLCLGCHMYLFIQRNQKVRPSA
jgi:hypothetical protein